MFEKLISTVLVPLVFVYTLLPGMLGNRSSQTSPEALPTGLHSLSDYVAYVEENGAPSYSTAVFVRQMAPVYELLRTLSGRPHATEGEKTLNAHIDATLSELCGYIAENSGIDVELLIETLPNLNKPAELANQVLHLDAAKMREMIFVLRDKAYAENYPLLGHLLFFFGVYLSIIREISIYTVPYGENPDEIEILMDIIYDDGDRAVVHPGIIIRPSTGEVYGFTDGGMIDLGFDVSVYDLLVYGTVHSWQREMGFDLFYDLLSDILPIYNLATRRIKFDYADKEWMIQLWKGNYGLASNGLEIGIYNRPKGSFGSYYFAASDDEMMPLSAKLYHGDKLLLEKGPVTHWWLSAFKLSPVIYLPDSMTMCFSITFPNKTMLAAFTAAVDRKAGNGLTYTLDGLTFNGIF